MKLEDIISAAREKSPNLELEVIHTDGQPVDITLRNVLAMPREDRNELFKEAEGLEEGVEEVEGDKEEVAEDRIAQLADQAKSFLKAVARTPEQFNILDTAISADANVADLSWISLFGSYTEETQLGEAESSQSS